MNIYLTDLTTNSNFTFPMIPESIDVENGAAFQSYDIMGVGEVKIPSGNQLTRISWNGIFPGAKHSRSNPGYIVAVKDPKAVQNWLDELRENKSKCRLLISDTPINIDVYVENYKMTYQHGMGDYYYDVSFIRAIELKVKTEVNTDTAPKPQNNRPEEPKKSTYTVVKGDSLWKIAQNHLGSGTRWREIYNLNQDKIKDPHWIYPGQQFVLP